MIMILLFFVFITLFGVGFIIILIGSIRKPRFNRVTKIGMTFFSLPVIVILVGLGYEVFHNIISTKPDEQDIVGTYQISDDSGLLKGHKLNKFKLVLKQDYTYTFTPIPMISICQEGKYELDYQFKLNELTFRCENGLIPAHLNRELGGFTIEFVIGDPDGGESIHFKKIQ
jgi:hypothetical protein